MIAAKVAALIISVFGVHAHDALTVARCESRLQPDAVSGKYGNVGVFQANWVHHRPGESWRAFVARMSNPRRNVIFAYRLSHHGTNWSAWTCRP